MADEPPLSTAVGGVLVTISRIIVRLQDFLSNVGDVDEAVKTFFISVRNLETSLSTVHKSLIEDHSILINSEAKQIYAALDYILSDCQHTTCGLDMILRKLGKKSLAEYRETMEQLRTGHSANEITKIRWRIRIYREVFQAYLLSVFIIMATTDHTHAPSYEFLEELRSSQHRLGEQLKKLENFVKHEEQTSRVPLEDEDDQHIMDDVKNFRLAAESVYITTYNKLSHWSPEAPSGPLTPHKHNEIRGWIELSDNSSSDEEPQVQQASTVRISKVFQEIPGSRSKFVEHELSPIELVAGETVLSEYQMILRTALINQGTEEYALGHYTNAYECFQEAYKLGSIGASPSKVMSDRRLKIWLSLSALRKHHLSRLSRGHGDTATKKAASLWKEVVSETPIVEGAEVSEDESQDACLLAESLIFAGEKGKAEAYCNFALRIGMLVEDEHEAPAIKRPMTPGAVIRLLYSKGPREPATAEAKNNLYHNALLTMVHLMYAKGKSELAQTWLSKVFIKGLEAIANQFFSQLSTMKPKDRLLEAIRRGNFYVALFVLKAPLDSDLHLKEKGPLYMYNAVSRDSDATITLLIEQGANLEDGPEGLEIAKTITPLYRAIECHNFKAAEMLIRAGVDTGHTRSLPVDKSLYLDVYPGIRFVSTPLGRAVAEGLQEIVEVLLDHGAKIHSKADGTLSVEPVLFTAIRFQAGRKLIPLLLERGANPNQVFGGIHPLTCAIICDQVRLSPSAKSTKLIEADAYVSTSREAIVKWLVAAGADVNVSYSRNGDPKIQKPIVELARKKGLKGIERLLQNTGLKHARKSWRRTGDGRTRAASLRGQ